MGDRKSDGTILLIAGVFLLLGSVVCWMWAWSEGWSALPVIASIVITGCSFVLGGFGLAKLVS